MQKFSKRAGGHFTVEKGLLLEGGKASGKLEASTEKLGHRRISRSITGYLEASAGSPEASLLFFAFTEIIV